MAAMITTATTSAQGVTFEVEPVPPSMVAKLLGQAVGERVVVDVLGRTLQRPRTYMLEVRCSCGGVDVVSTRSLGQVGRQCGSCRQSTAATDRARRATACARPKEFWAEDSLEARIEESAIARAYGRPLQAKEIGHIVGLSRQRVSQIEALALSKLFDAASGWEP